MDFADSIIDHQLRNGERMTHGSDKNLLVSFYTKAVKNNFRSENEGKPCFDNVEYVKILLPGDKNTEVDRPATVDDKERFAQQYARFLQKKEAVIEGTPLEHWPVMDPATVEDCKASKIFTVEQVADLSDMQIQKLGMGYRELSKKAKAFLEYAKDTALPQKQAAEIERLHADNGELKRQLAELAARVEAQETKKSRKGE
jgi:hypothetical protein